MYCIGIVNITEINHFKLLIGYLHTKRITFSAFSGTDKLLNLISNPILVSYIDAHLGIT